jgi:uncharacterized protein YjgD (DUF1641 family)
MAKNDTIYPHLDLLKIESQGVYRILYEILIEQIRNSIIGIAPLFGTADNQEMKNKQIGNNGSLIEMLELVEDESLKQLFRKIYMDINQKLDQLIANQGTPGQLNTIGSNITTILGIVNGSTSGQPVTGATTTTAKITNLNLADASVSATSAGLFTAGNFTINGVTVTVNPNDSLATIATNIQAGLQAANHVNATAAASDSPGNFTLIVIDPSTGSGAGFAGAAVAGLTIPAPVYS